MATDFGNDIECLTDLSASMREITGREALIQCIVNGLKTPQGGLFYAPEWGHDVRQYINAPPPGPGAIERAVRVQCMRDERVEDALATVEWNEGTKSMTIKLSIVDAVGPFDLVLGVSKVTVELLRGDS